VLLNNEGESAVEISVRIPAATHATSATELFSGSPLELSHVIGAQFSLHLPAEDGAMVLLT
jgi:hypothetical protein